ncbi:MAG: hypothetical protein IJI35_12635, partial [Kiritimatiellae bacterium]|nr:hypothetical protein [Kiritimatiellia bacterium]
MNTGKQNVYLVWLNWPERCFCAGSGDIAYLESLVPRGSRVVRVAGERAFLRELPTATHAIVWNFRREWCGGAPRRRRVAAPAAGAGVVAAAGPGGG